MLLGSSGTGVAVGGSRVGVSAGKGVGGTVAVGVVVAVAGSVGVGGNRVAVSVAAGVAVGELVVVGIRVGVWLGAAVFVVVTLGANWARGAGVDSPEQAPISRLRARAYPRVL